MKRAIYLAGFILAFLLISTNAGAQGPTNDTGGVRVVNPMKMGGKIAIACGYEHDLLWEEKFELLNKYVVPNYIVHHNGEPDIVGADAWKAWASARPKRDVVGCPGVTSAFQNGNYVVFIRLTMVPNSKFPGQLVARKSFAVWRFEGNKIAEHWAS